MMSPRVTHPWRGQEKEKATALMQSSCLLRFCFCCLVGWTTPSLVLGEWDRTLLRDQDAPYKQGPTDGLGQRLLLWLLSLAAFYGLVRLLEDITVEQTLPAGQEEAGVANCDMCLIRRPSLPKRGCPIKASLKSLERMEQDLVTLLYGLRKHKITLVRSWSSEDQPTRSEQGSLPNDVVIYTIQDET
ncbi:hypothetical protein JRQ81_009116 [Phrynocephalus forsythii]|uniref:Uncharacterized protein n=1 Tax=Phrynocephalus forsythii TaxID=171643 RepID=A0A9Q0X990_9SAUR|nr:hypothetical protein JRQ81_009116 [Phrynocephalus forsythii]